MILKQILQSIKKPDIGIDENTALGDIGLDSLEQVEAVISLEDEFDISLDENLFENVKTIKDLENELDNTINTN